MISNLTKPFLKKGRAVICSFATFLLFSMQVSQASVVKTAPANEIRLWDDLSNQQMIFLWPIPRQSFIWFQVKL